MCIFFLFLNIKGVIEKNYTVTQEKQNQLTSVITSYLN